MERSHSWSIAEDWKSSGPKAHQGSNPCLSASILRAAVPKGSCGVFFDQKNPKKGNFHPKNPAAVRRRYANRKCLKEKELR